MKRKWVRYSVFLGCVVLWSLFTVFVQVRELGIPYLQGRQLNRHTVVLEGTAPGHWQYRLLSTYLVEWTLELFKTLGIPFPIVSAFIVFRIVQNIIIFVLAGVYYDRLGLPDYHIMFGLTCLAWGMSHALYGSDLQFSTYSDMIFYLLAGLVILHSQYLWIVPITILAALNRGTSGLIPFMLGSVGVSELLQRKQWDKNTQKIAGIALTALACYGGIILGLRYSLGPRPPFYPYGVHFGMELFVYNVGRIITWTQVFATVGVLPILALISIHRWPSVLKLFLITIVPIWLLIHSFFSVMGETRNLLVPYALIVVPGALCGLIPPSKNVVA